MISHCHSSDGEDRFTTYLVVHFRKKRTLVELLRGWRNVNCWVAIKEVHWLHSNFDDLAWHYLKFAVVSIRFICLKKSTTTHRKIFDTGDMVHAKLNEEHQIVVDNVVLPCSPAADSSPTTRLVRIFTTCISESTGSAKVSLLARLECNPQLAIAIFHGVDVLIRKLCSLIIEALSI